MLSLSPPPYFFTVLVGVIVLFSCGTGAWTQGLQPFSVMGFFEIESHKLFAWAVFKPWSSDLCLLSSQDYRHEPLEPGSLYCFHIEVWEVPSLGCCWSWHARIGDILPLFSLLGNESEESEIQEKVINVGLMGELFGSIWVTLSGLIEN
jgi:hypothetical protein